MREKNEFPCFHLLVHFPVAYYGQCCGMLKLGSRSSIQICHTVAAAITVTSQGAHQQEAGIRNRAEHQTRHSNMGGGVLTGVLTARPNARPLSLHLISHIAQHDPQTQKAISATFSSSKPCLHKLLLNIGSPT